MSFVLHLLCSITTAVFFFTVGNVFAQTNISGTVNAYSAVTAIATNVGGTDCNMNLLTLANPGPFNVGDLVLIMQMQGSAPRRNNGPEYGEVTTDGALAWPLANAGHYEFNRIASKTGANVTFQKPLANIYDVAGRVQLVRVPEYPAGATVLAAGLTGNAWDGTTGGVLAIHVTGVLTLNGEINMDGRGFRGGADFASTANNCNQGVRFYNNASQLAANKGEGIAIYNLAHARGRGRWVNGGGGGNSRFGGGGGGANFSAGGNGGSHNCDANNVVNTPGAGGFALGPFVSNTRVFMGGGGGAGHRTTGTAAPGGNGGGIVIIHCTTLNGNGNVVSANGNHGADVNNANGGAGGGGAGGSILIQLNNFSSNVTIRANGGRGGNHSVSGCYSPGGGGAGGVIRTSIAPPVTPTVVRQVNGGAAGTRTGTCTAGGAPTAGIAGATQVTLLMNFNTSCLSAVYDIGSLCGGALGQNSFAAGDFGATPGTPGVIPGPGELITVSPKWTDPSPVTCLAASTLAPEFNYVSPPANGQPADNFYTVCTGIRDPYGPFTGVVNQAGVVQPGQYACWITSNDNSGTNSGYTQIVNAAHPPRAFYNQTVNDLCENTKYEFRIDVINLYTSTWVSQSNPNGFAMNWFPTCDDIAEPGCRQMVFARTRDCPFAPAGNCKRYSILPEVLFLLNGAPIGTTGPIPNDDQWHTYGVSFTTSPGVTSVNLSLRNRAPGGIGNDLALDNISFRPCGPTVTLSQSNPCPPSKLTANVGADFTTPVYQWQVSTDGGVNYVDISGATAVDYDVPVATPATNIYRVRVANAVANLSNPNCYVTSSNAGFSCPMDVDVLTFKATKYENAQALLEWTLSQNRTVAEYRIERSSSAWDFEVLAVKNGETPLYAYLDPAPLPGINHYRLRVTDFDGVTRYSEVRSLDFTPYRKEMRVYPNPSHGWVSVAVSATAQARLEVFAFDGKRVAEFEHSGDGEKFDLDLTHLPDGIYLVVLKERGAPVATQKWVKN